MSCCSNPASQSPSWVLHHCSVSARSPVLEVWSFDTTQGCPVSVESAALLAGALTWLAHCLPPSAAHSLVAVNRMTTITFNISHLMYKVLVNTNSSVYKAYILQFLLVHSNNLNFLVHSTSLFTCYSLFVRCYSISLMQYFSTGIGRRRTQCSFYITIKLNRNINHVLILLCK